MSTDTELRFAKGREFYDTRETLTGYPFIDVDEDGFIFVLGRASDTFTSKSGQKIYCFDIENVIMENENIAQCEVVGHDKGGFEVPAVHIVLEDTCTKSQKQILEEVHQNCVTKLPEECIPCGYKFCEAFPIKNSGKRDMEMIRQDRSEFIVPEVRE